MFLEGRADISAGEGRYLWRVELLCLWRGGQKFVEGRADILEGGLIFLEWCVYVCGG